MVLRSGQSVADHRVGDTNMDDVVKNIVGAVTHNLDAIMSGR
jgi:hypothetical protein